MEKGIQEALGKEGMEGRKEGRNDGKEMKGKNGRKELGKQDAFKNKM